MVPSISAAVKQGNKEREKQLVLSGIKLCAIISLPIGLGIGLYSEQILNFIFPKEQYAVGVASPLLSALGTSVFASCLVQVTNSVLQANGKIVHPIISMLAGLVVKTLSAYVLIGNPRIGAIGAPISTLLCNLTAVGLNLWFLSRALQLDVALDKCLFKPCACAVTAIFLSLAPYLGALKFGASEKTAFLAAAVFCAAIYFLSIVVCGVFDSEERDFFKLSKRKVIKE
jgi:stage V sporulation protein B